MMTLFRAAPAGSSPRRMIALALGLVLALMAGRALAAGSEETLAPAISPIEEVQAVIESQLIAFQNRDGAGAFFHAAPGIKGAFGDADTFMAMVERGYNVIYSNSGWTFVEGQVQGEQAAQMLVVEDGEGRELKVIYFLRLFDGRWQITGVQPMA
ncbi:MAG: DUF4864 domain-containing protein [Alphaproteobacteria bacterium]|nr:DUF4864 domain-containing protein [Alphaproteobacteria bacterium]